MILYNVTVILDEDIHQEWLEWMQGQHIPEVMSTGHFTSNRMLKVLDSPNEGVTYCIQYMAENMQQYQQYKENHASRLQAAYPEQFANKFVSFRTIMEYVDQA